jgi:ATP-dependent Clp protease ATP-binding subunit ClpA
MREGFTRTLRQVMSFAQQEARTHRQEFVGTEHLFIGVLRCHDCEAETVLAEAGLDPARLRDHVARDLPTGDDAPVITGDLPLSPKAQRTINGAIVKAQALRESQISTRFLLLSLVDEPQTLIREALQLQGGDVNQLRQALVEAPTEAED